MKRKSLIVAALAGLSLAVPAQAQRVWRDGQWVQRGASAPVQYPARSVPQTRINPPQGGGWTRGGPQGGGQMRGGPIAGGRWGTKIGGRWHAGMQAPGGWSAYRRPVRGWTLPSYWMGGSYFLSDWTNWGLTSPPHGYFWVRYYDDAVLVDRGGRVWDSVRGVDWDRGAGGDAYAYADDGYAYAEARGGAGGSGYGAGYAAPDDADEDHYRPAPIPAQPYPGGYAPPPRYGAPAAPTRGYSGGYSGGYAQGSGYASGGYYVAPSVTTVVIQSAPVVTTTIVEEVIEEEVVRYARPKRVYRAPAPVKRVKRVPRSGCYCE